MKNNVSLKNSKIIYILRIKNYKNLFSVKTCACRTYRPVKYTFKKT